MSPQPPPSVPITSTPTSANSPSSSSSTSRSNTTNSSSSNAGDSLFEPSVDMMINDFDDERTLEEEEALAANDTDDTSVELSNLQRERDMPLDELLALYNCHQTSGSSESVDAAPSSVSSNNENDESVEEQNGLDDLDEDESELRTLYPETFNTHDPKLLSTLSRAQSEEDEDIDYSPDEDDFKKTIMVGSEFQAVIPEGLCKYDDALPYENEDKLVWDPSHLSENEIEDYLKRAHGVHLANLRAIISSGSGSSGCGNTSNNTSGNSSTGNGNNNTTINNLNLNILNVPVGSHLRDDEQALYLLLQCGHNVEEALRRCRMSNSATTSNSSCSSTSSSAAGTETMPLWSEEECRNFESGIRIYGKDFHAIQQDKVRTRSVGELVQFYYLWKKTERHDIFANKARLDKKKYSLHPGTTDYMDRFLEEQEIIGNHHLASGSGSAGGGSGGGGAASVSGGSSGGSTTGGGGNFGSRDRSTSPGINNSLLYADYKRQRISSSSTATTTTTAATTAIPTTATVTATTATVTSDQSLDITNNVANRNNNSDRISNESLNADPDDETCSTSNNNNNNNSNNSLSSSKNTNRHLNG